MHTLVGWVGNTLDFVVNDFKQDELRFVLELIGVVCSIAASLILAVTIKDPLMAYTYTLWLIGSACLVTASLSRGSTGFTLIYGTFLCVDSIGMLRLYNIF